MSSGGNNSFTGTTGSWDDASLWTQGVPTSSETVVVTGTTSLLTVSGSDDVFAAASFTGLSDTTNTIDVTGTLTGSGGSGLELLLDEDLKIASGGVFDVTEIGTVSGAKLDIYGTLDVGEGVNNGGIGAGARVTNSTIVVEAGGELTTPQINEQGSGNTIIVDGTLHITGGGDGLDSTSTHIVNQGGTVTVDGTEGGNWTINGGTYKSSVSYQGGTFSFSGTNGVLDLPDNALWNSNLTITNFGTTDTLILGTASGTGALTTTIVNGNTLEVLQNNTVIGRVEHFTMASGQTLSSTSAEVVNGQVVVNGSFCFYAGTRIATPSGEVAVEHIRAGDMVLTAGGQSLPVRWVGQSLIATRFADKLRSLPIRIKAGALAEGVPARDLLVSPDHALFLGGVLVQAGALVNGTTILREADVPELFTYYHVELASHELLLAEGAPAESFVDNVDRMNFFNWNEREAPCEAIQEMSFPRAKSARQVPAAVRREIEARAVLFTMPQAA